MQYRIRCAMAVALCAIASPVGAQIYQAQAVASAVSSDCSDSEATGLVSQPAVHASASCVTTGSAVASATVDLPTATAALALAVTPPLAGGSNAAGEAQFIDNFLFDVPDGLLGPNENLVVGVTLTLDASVAPGTVSSSAILASYNLGLSDFYYFSSPGSSFVASGNIDGPMSGATDFVGTVEVHPPFLLAQLSMTLASFSGIQDGAVDLVGSVALDLPPGVTWTSSSGVLLTVPEPSAALEALASVLALALTSAWTRARTC